MSIKIDNEILNLLQELRSDHGIGHKEILEAISRLDAKIERLHADMMEMSAEIGRVHAEFVKANAVAKDAQQDPGDLRKERRRSSRLH